MAEEEGGGVEGEEEGVERRRVESVEERGEEEGVERRRVDSVEEGFGSPTVLLSTAVPTVPHSTIFYNK